VWGVPLFLGRDARPPYHVTIVTSSMRHAERVAAKIPGAKAVSRSKIVVSKVDGDEDGSRVLEMLVSNERVVCVEEKPRYNLLNKWSAVTVQSGMKCPPCTEEDGCSECGRSDGMTPVWEMGLKGDGEILGCGDTGYSSPHILDSSFKNPHDEYGMSLESVFGVHLCFFLRLALHASLLMNPKPQTPDPKP
jgi:hypothetical protein